MFNIFYISFSKRQLLLFWKFSNELSVVIFIDILHSNKLSQTQAFQTFLFNSGFKFVLIRRNVLTIINKFEVRKRLQDNLASFFQFYSSWITFKWKLNICLCYSKFDIFSHDLIIGRKLIDKNRETYLSQLYIFRILLNNLLY